MLPPHLCLGDHEFLQAVSEQERWSDIMANTSKITRKSSRGLLKQGALFWFTQDPCGPKRESQSPHCVMKRVRKDLKEEKQISLPHNSYSFPLQILSFFFCKQNKEKDIQIVMRIDNLGNKDLWKYLLFRSEMFQFT